MFDHLLNGLKLLVLPRRSWERINNLPYSALKLAAYTALLASFAFVWRVAGNVLLGMGFALAFIEGMLSTLMSVGAAVTMGLLLMPFSRLARRPTNDGHAMKLALFAATPIWLLGIFQAAPVPLLRILFLLISLGYAALLLFRGLPRLFGTEPTHTLVVSLVISSVWVIGLVLFSQIFLGLALAL